MWYNSMATANPDKARINGKMHPKIYRKVRSQSVNHQPQGRKIPQSSNHQKQITKLSLGVSYFFLQQRLPLTHFAK
jgi:hypothetical protein